VKKRLSDPWRLVAVFASTGSVVTPERMRGFAVTLKVGVSAEEMNVEEAGWRVRCENLEY